MEPYSKKENQSIPKEIERMASRLRKKYPNYSEIFSKTLAEELYQNGIHLDKLTEYYYHSSFNLEEIILYLAKKLERKDKILSPSFKEKSVIPKEEDTPSQIFSFQMKPIEPTSTMKCKVKRFHKEVKKCQNYQK